MLIRVFPLHAPDRRATLAVMCTRIGQRRYVGWIVLAGVLSGCPSNEPRIQVAGAIVDEAGNAVKPTRVEIRTEGYEPVECIAWFGSYRCFDLARDRVYTLTLERGATVYTEVVSFADADCRNGCTLQRPFTVETAPEGACSADTLTLVARLVSPTPREIGAVTAIWFTSPVELDLAILPADATSEHGRLEPGGETEQSLYAEANLPSATTLVLQADILANGTWCREHGGWPGGTRLRGDANIEFQPRPGSDPCSYDPVELRVEPDDLVDCHNN